MRGFNVERCLGAKLEIKNNKPLWLIEAPRATSEV